MAELAANQVKYYALANGRLNLMPQPGYKEGSLMVQNSMNFNNMSVLPKLVPVRSIGTVESHFI